LGNHFRSDVVFGVAPNEGGSLLGLPALGSMGKFSIDMAKLELTVG
jgi:hypothetical protein